MSSKKKGLGRGLSALFGDSNHNDGKDETNYVHYYDSGLEKCIT